MPLHLSSHNAGRERGTNRKSCQPCSQRKVRCDKDGVQPCSNCVRRNQSERCDLGLSSRSRAQPHHAGSPRSRESLLKQGAVGTALEVNESARPTTQPDSHSANRTSSRRMSTGESTRVGTSLGNQVQLPSASGDTNIPLHIGEPAMATFIRHQADSTGFRLPESLTSMLGLQNHDSGYPFLDLGASEDRWTELKPILPSPFEVWRSALPYKLIARDL